MTETIDTANLRALAAAADAQPYNVIVTGNYAFAMNKLKARPDQVVALLDRLAAAEARNATLTDDAARWQAILAHVQKLGPEDFMAPINGVEAWVKTIDSLVAATKEGDTHADT